MDEYHPDSDADDHEDEESDLDDVLTQQLNIKLTTDDGREEKDKKTQRSRDTPRISGRMRSSNVIKITQCEKVKL